MEKTNDYRLSYGELSELGLSYANTFQTGFRAVEDRLVPKLEEKDIEIAELKRKLELATTTLKTIRIKEQNTGFTLKGLDEGMHSIGEIAKRCLNEIYGE